MNFYKRYVGDIQRDTGHLSLAEFGAYDRLLDHYYATEMPLPAEFDACCRIARAMDKNERKAVESILKQYFKLTADGYTQSRTEKEIADAQPAMVSARLNGQKGGRPKKTENNNQNETQEKPNGLSENNPDKTQHESSPEPEPDIKPNELTHSKETNTSVDPTLAASVCLAIKDLGYIDINPSHPRLQAMLAAGATLDEFVNAAKVAKPSNKKFVYLLGTVEGMRKQAACDNVTQGNFAEVAASKAWRKSDAGIMEKAKELKIGTQGLDKFQLLAMIDAKLEQLERQEKQEKIA